MNLHRYMISQR